MPTLNKTTEGTVSQIWGSALIRNVDGKMVPLKVGDVVHQGDQILTTQRGIVQITPAEQPPVLARAPEELEFAPPGAGLSAGDSGALTEGLRVARIAEGVTPADLTLGPTDNPSAFDLPNAPPSNRLGVVAQPLNQPPQALAASLTGTEDTALNTPLLGQDDSAVASLTVTQLPTNGTLLLADGVTPVAAGQTLDPAQAQGLLFVPRPDFNGPDQILFFATDDAGAASSVASIDINLLPVNDLPLVQTDVAFTPEDTPLTLPVAALLGNDTDPDGDPLSVISAQNPSNGTVTLIDGNVVFTPNANYHGPASFTYTVSDAQGGLSTGLVNVTVQPVNDAPVANADLQTLSDAGLGSTLVFNAANGVIQSNQNLAGRDFDIDVEANNTVDTLQVVGIRASNQASALEVGGDSGASSIGVLGTLNIQADGSYTYALNNNSAAFQSLAAGQSLPDVFEYTLSDGQGGSDTTTLTFNVTRGPDLTAPPPTLTPLASSGLNGAYYGYNDRLTTAPGARTHSDDGTALFGQHGPAGNLNAVEDVALIINGRNVAAGGANGLVGSANQAHPSAADVSFKAQILDYGFSPITTTLGNNPLVAPAAPLPVGGPTSGSLSRFLGPDALSAVAQTGGANTNATSGLGATSDGAIRLAGQIYLPPGHYDFRVTADDGFRLRVGGETVMEYDANQWPTTRIVTHVALGDFERGLQSFELLYWEQGGDARLKIEFKPTSEPAANYQVMTHTNTGLFGTDDAPLLSDPRIQDLVYNPSTGWQVRTGSLLDGDERNNLLMGGPGRDRLLGRAGDDQLQGQAGSDQLEGGEGNDTLVGGAHNDLLIGGAGADTVIGGVGDDTYRISDDADTLIELAGQGIDTVELDATFVASHAGTVFALSSHFEHLSAFGVDNIDLSGNATTNHLTGNQGQNVIDGMAGNDVLRGGGGNDQLIGGLGADVFAWHLSDAGAPGTPAIDTIEDFHLGSGHSTIQSSIAGVAIGGGDMLDFRDLLQGERTTASDLGVPAQQASISNLLNYLDIEVSGGNTVLHISSTGAFAGGSLNAVHEDQRVVLNNFDLYAAAGVGAGEEARLLQTLIKSGTLTLD